MYILHGGEPPSVHPQRPTARARSPPVAARRGRAYSGLGTASRVFLLRHSFQAVSQTGTSHPRYLCRAASRPSLGCVWGRCWFLAKPRKARLRARCAAHCRSGHTVDRVLLDRAGAVHPGIVHPTYDQSEHVPERAHPGSSSDPVAAATAASVIVPKRWRRLAAVAAPLWSDNNEGRHPQHLAPVIIKSRPWRCRSARSACWCRSARRSASPWPAAQATLRCAWMISSASSNDVAAGGEPHMRRRFGSCRNHTEARPMTPAMIR
jgi:hypothetical protein